MTAAIARCRAEQAAAAEAWRAAATPGDRAGAYLGYCDWLGEELLLLAEDSGGVRDRRDTNPGRMGPRRPPPGDNSA